jgi:hypothetical protein
MENGYSVDDLIDFLGHAGERGLMPVATAQALAVASRNVFGILNAEERADLRAMDLDAVIRRFNNKRAREFNPSSLKEYGRRVHRAVTLFKQWRDDPANFSTKTRNTASSSSKQKGRSPTPVLEVREGGGFEYRSANSTGSGQTGYQSAVAIRPGTIVTLNNIPPDLTAEEAERLAQFVKMLVVQ